MQQSFMIQNQHKKSATFLSTNNEQSKKEIKEKIPSAIASERIKYLEISLTKELKDYTGNYKTLLSEVKEIEKYPLFIDWKT